MLEAVLDRAHEFLADHRPHRPAEKAELERDRDELEARERPRHHHERIALAGLLLRLDETVLVALRVFELERILRLDLGGEFLGGPGIEELQQPVARIDAHVMAAFGADVEVALDLRPIQHGIARRAFDPQTLGHGTRAALGFDARGNDSLEPSHATV